MATSPTISTTPGQEPGAAAPLDFPAPGPAFMRAADPRARLMTAMAQAVAERGYAGTTVADVVRIAQASRRTFYNHFEDRADCFLALGDELTEYALQLVATASGSPELPWRERIEAGLDSYLKTCAATPGLTRSYLLELFGMGDRGLAHRRTAMRRWARALHEVVEDCRRESPELGEMSPQTAMAIVGGIWELSLIAAEEGRPGDVSEIRRVASQLIADVLTAPRP